jgi:4-amino-4-deoxy-L-arabinose transferase-like glycosyltransferase
LNDARPEPSARRPDRPNRLVPAAVAVLLAIHAALALWAVSGESVTHDELLHVTGGYFYDKFGDYRIQPENGNLPQRLAALPAVLMGAPPPKLEDNIYWQTSDASVVGHQFFYETGHDHWPMLMAGRCVMMVFSLGTGLLVFGWARRLFGDAAGMFALTLYVFDPNVLANAPLATSDSAAVFFLLASCTAFWAHLHKPKAGNAALSAVTFGLACVAKYSAAFLLPMFVLLLAWRIAREVPPQRRRWLWLAPLTLAAHAAAAVFIIWAFFGFRYSGFGPGVPAAAHYIVPWEGVLPYIGLHGKVVEFCRSWHLLPEAFLYGYSWVVQSAQLRASFLAGEYGLYGWVSFFPLAFWWKTPVALLVGLVAGGAVLARRGKGAAGRWRGELTAVAPLLVLFAVYWAFSITSKLNIGHRHILPTYPTLFILVGGLAAPGVFAGWRRGAVVGSLVAGLLIANARVAPHYLAFFNVFAGGPANGHRLLVDSSLDWGQDLPGLAEWLRAHNRGPGAVPVFLSYFGSGEPDYYGIQATRLPFVNGFKQAPRWSEPKGGLYCVGATMLQEVYSPVRGGFTLGHEKEYQERRRAVPVFNAYWHDPAARENLLKQFTTKQLDATWARYDWLRFARLATYLRVKPPEAVIGYSIFVFRLTDDEVNRVLNGRYSDWLAAVEAPLPR